MKQIFCLDKGLTQTISHYSRLEDADKDSDGNGKYIYKGCKKITALDKIKDFYFRTSISIIIGALILFIITNMPLWIEEEMINPPDVKEVQDPPAPPSNTEDESG